MSSKSTTVRRRRRIFKGLLASLIVLLLLLALLVALLPVLGNMAAVNWLEQQGLDADIDKIALDFNDASLTVHNARGTNSDGKGFSIERLYLDLAWKPLLDNILRIESFELGGVHIDSLADSRGLNSVAGIALPPADESEVPEQGGVSPSSAWRVEIADVSLGDIKYCHTSTEAAQHLCVQLGRLSWLGSIKLDFNRPPADQVKIKGGLQLSDVAIRDMKQDRVLLSQDALRLSALSLESMDHVVLDNLRLDGFKLLPGISELSAAQIVRLDSLQLQALSLKDKRLHIRQILFQGPGASIYRDEKGQWEVIQALGLSPGDSAEKAPDQTNPQTSRPLAVQIDGVQISDAHPVHFQDDSLPTPFKFSAQIRTFQLDNMNTAKPDQSSHLKLQLVTDEHGSVELEGDLQLLAAKRDFDIQGKVRGLDLRPVGAYIQTGLGHRIKSGQLNAELDLRAQNSQLNSKLDIELRHFELKKLDKKARDELSESIGLPLSTALNLLRDSDNTIKLSIPVKGDINSPEFDPSDVIRKATSTAITAAVINYYTPLGLVTVTQGLYNLATALRFDPVVFTAGVGKIADAQKSHIDKLATLLKKRPELHLSLCGYSNIDDARTLMPEQLPSNLDEFRPSKELSDRLAELASERGAAVKTYLVGKGIAADRLVVCEGEFEADAVGGVEISI